MNASAASVYARLLRVKRERDEQAVRDRRDAPSPSDSHNLLGLIDENVEAFALQEAKPGGNRGRGQIVKDERAVLCGVWQAGLNI